MTAEIFDMLGLPEYQAIEGFVASRGEEYVDIAETDSLRDAGSGR